jgi:hypothetical protein
VGQENEKKKRWKIAMSLVFFPFSFPFLSFHLVATAPIRVSLRTNLLGVISLSKNMCGNATQCERSFAQFL